MIFAYIKQNEKTQLSCVDKIGGRAFLLEDFFQRDLSELCIESNHLEITLQTMDELIENYDELWTDDMALFFGSNPELGILLDKEHDWAPLTNLDEIWSPLEKTRGLGLL